MKYNIKINFYIKCSKAIQLSRRTFKTNEQVLNKIKNEPVDVIPPMSLERYSKKNYPTIVTTQWIKICCLKA